MRILVVDGDYKTRLKLKTLLSAFGDCDAVPSGEAGVWLFAVAHKEQAPYGLIATESRLPDMTGDEMIEKIRQWENTQLKIPADKQVKILKTSFPNSVDDLRVLVVDDDYVSRSKLKSLLSAYGICDTAPDGKIALALFNQAHQEGQPYGLISLDLNMPGMRGLDVTSEIRRWEAEQGITSPDLQVKIVVVTGTEDANDLADSFSRGAQGYIQKPIIPGALRISLENMGIIPRKV